MPSPFPGMDPYLEMPAVWPDFHASLYAVVRAELNKRLPPRYAARMDRYIWIHEPDAEQRTLLGKPDVYVADPSDAPGKIETAVALAAPVQVVLPATRREGNRYLKVVDLQEHRVVTVIEILSPSNKNPGPDRDAYLLKRSEYLALGVNLVEIDLLRAGGRMPCGKMALPSADYYVLVSPASIFPHAGIWPLTIRQALPEIRVPLAAPNEPTLLPLQTCFDRAYDDGRYALELNYAEPPTPPLREPEASWARELLAARPR